MPEINYTKIGNTITISSDYIKNLGSVNRLGTAQVEFTTPTVTLNEDIFFKFYTCDDSGAGTKVYTELNVEAATALDMERMLTMVFLNYYANSTIVNELSTQGNSFSPLAERLSGVVTPTTPLASTITMPASSSNFVEFVGMGLGSRVGAAYINGGISGRSQLWGTRVAQVHITATNPLGPAPIEALYDNTDLGCWNFATYNTTGLIVYTNLTSAFTPPKGLAHWGQVLCVWPIIARVKNAQYACMFNNFDQSFMKSGLGYFDRAARKDTYFGWAGNYIQSIFNDWGIPVISPIWSMSDLALATYVTYGTLGGSAGGNYGSIALPQKQFRFVGPVADNNITSVVEKSVRSSLPLLWANESRYGSVNATTSAIPDFNNVVLNILGYSTVGDYVAACLLGVQEGYNAHLYRYMLQGQAQSGVPTVTRGFITSGVSWSSKLSTQPTLLSVFTDSLNGYPKYYEPAVSSFFSIVAGTYGAALKARIQDGVLIVVRAMNATEMSRVTAWLYTP
jgi:hypothetical protein